VTGVSAEDINALPFDQCRLQLVSMSYRNASIEWASLAKRHNKPTHSTR